MKLFFVMLFLGMLLSNGYADDVYLKNGDAYKNVLVIDTVNTNIRMLFRGDTLRLDFSSVLFINKSRYDAFEGSYITTEFPDANSGISLSEFPLTKKHTKVKGENILLSALSFALAWEYYELASLPTTNEVKQRRNIITGVAAVTGIVFLYYSFETEDVSVSITNNSLTLSYVW